jgi:hypothetical protein
MQSEIVALLAPEGGPEAALLVRRGDGQYQLARIDARLGAAARMAAAYANVPYAAGSRQGAAKLPPSR